MHIPPVYSTVVCPETGIIPLDQADNAAAMGGLII